MKVTLITGTRPQIIKSVPVIKEIQEADSIEFCFYHTGQHYDDVMFKNFIEDFDLPMPLNLDILDNLEYSFVNTVRRLLGLWHVEEYRPDLVLVPGDTDSAFAASLAAIRLDIPVVHIESGVREYDMTMFEERNRRMIDHTASLLCVPTQDAWSNLIREAVLGEMLFCGDTNYDLFLQRKKIFHAKRFSQAVNERYNTDDEYVLLTIHRAANVDNWKQLHTILYSIKRSGKRFIFPVHPRTRKTLNNMDIELPNVELIDPVPYDTMMNLVEKSMLVVTDSGGLQKEAYFAKVPCVTLRDVTAWPETTKYGLNMLVGTDRIVEGIESQYGKRVVCLNVYGIGNAAQMIVDYIVDTPIKIPKR